MDSGRKFFSVAESDCLKELMGQYPCIMSVSYDSSQIEQRKTAWKQITMKYNSIETNQKKTESQLRKCWGNIKAERKRRQDARDDEYHQLRMDVLKSQQKLTIIQIQNAQFQAQHDKEMAVLHKEKVLNDIDLQKKLSHFILEKAKLDYESALRKHRTESAEK